MFTKFTTLVSAIAVVAMVGSTAQADPIQSRYRQLDDIAFTAYIDARELRWDLNTDFAESHDFEVIVGNSIPVLIAIQNLQNSILQERSDILIEREVNNVLQKTADLARHLNNSDFARVSQGRSRTTYNGRGYVFTPERQHAGRAYVDSALRRIARIESTLDKLAHQVGRQSRPAFQRGHVPLR